MVAEKKKLSEMVGSLEYEELINLHRDLFNGGAQMKQLISNRIKEVNASESRICGTCGSGINLRVSKEYTLIFGPYDLKKRVSFCALDCLDYFFTRLKAMSSKKLQKAQE